MRYRIPLILVFALAFPALGIADESKAADAKETTKEETKVETKKKQAAKEGPIRLESVFVGDKEQPAVSYFIPWQGVGTPDKLHWNMERKHDDELKMVDRDVMLRSIQMYNDMKLEAP